MSVCVMKDKWQKLILGEETCLLFGMKGTIYQNIYAYHYFCKVFFEIHKEM